MNDYTHTWMMTLDHQRLTNVCIVYQPADFYYSSKQFHRSVALDLKYERFRIVYPISGLKIFYIKDSSVTNNLGILNALPLMSFRTAPPQATTARLMPTCRNTSKVSSLKSP